MFTANANNTANDLKSDVKLGAARAKDDIRQSAETLTHDFEGAANKAGRKIRAYFDHASDEVTHAADVVKTQIRTKPVQSSLMALAAGFVLGALYRR